MSGECIATATANVQIWRGPTTRTYRETNLNNASADAYNNFPVLMLLYVLLLLLCMFISLYC